MISHTVIKAISGVIFDEKVDEVKLGCAKIIRNPAWNGQKDFPGPWPSFPVSSSAKPHPFLNKYWPLQHASTYVVEFDIDTETEELKWEYVREK